MIKHLQDHVVQTDQDYQIKSCDKTILVIAPPGGSVDNMIRLRLPRHVDPGQKFIVVAADIDVTVLSGEES